MKNTKEHQAISFRSMIAILLIGAVSLSIVSCTEDETEEEVTVEVEVTALSCSDATFSAEATVNTQYEGIATLPFTGGSGASYEAGSAISSTGLTGFTATLQAGTLSEGDGELTFDIAGISTEMAGGTAYFSISFGGQACVLELAVASTIAGGGDMPDGGTGPGGSGSSNTNDGDDLVDAVEVTACVDDDGIEKIVCIADELIALLDDTQYTSLQLDYSVDDAKRWSNFPEAIYGNRVGIPLGDMDSTQVAYAKALLKQIMGTRENEGWDEIQQMLDADNYLRESGGASEDYGSFNYYLAFLGTPSTSGTFEIMFGGHHMAISNTYSGGALVGATPSFRGVEPFFEFEWEGAAEDPMDQDRDAFSAMLEGLTTDQLATAKLSGTYGDLIAGPQSDDNFPENPSGIACSELTSAQQELVLAAIATYVEDISDDEAAVFMAKYESELDDTYIAYSGGTDITSQNDYVRIDGPSVWIEFLLASGVIYQNEPHPHTVWRDKTSDYGGN